MARMNISIPDPLYERLDRLRDRVNASKVCASALEKELDMIEGRTDAAGIGDPDIAQLLRRLQSLRDRWYDRGREDAKEWAVGRATRDELWRVRDEYGDEKPEEMAQAILHHQHGPRPWWPGSFDVRATLEDWVRRDLRDADQAGAEEGAAAASDAAAEGDF